MRRCDTFVGLGANHLRVAVRPEWLVLVDAIAEVLGECSSARCHRGLDDAYPPHLAHSWDSVGLVWRPDDVVDSVTVAVDATAAVVDAVGERGCCWRTIHCCCGALTPWPQYPKGKSDSRVDPQGWSHFHRAHQR